MWQKKNVLYGVSAGFSPPYEFLRIYLSADYGEAITFVITTSSTCVKVITMITNSGDSLEIPKTDIQALLDNLVTSGQAIAATLFITRPDGSVLPIGDTANAPLFPWHGYTPPKLR